MNNGLTVAFSVVIAGLVAGCASSGVQNPNGVPVTEMRPDERGFVAGTGIESQDLVAVTDKMARSILSIPQIVQAHGQPCIVLDPVKNNTRFPINKDIFLTRIRVQLNSKAAGKVMFLARDRMEALEKERALKQSGQVTASADPNVVEFKGADFFLTGTLDGMSTRTSAGTSDYILYSFQLIDARTSGIIWEDSAEIKSRAWKTPPIVDPNRRVKAMKNISIAVGGAVLVWLCGCVTQVQRIDLTGDITIDAPHAIAVGPPRDRVLWEDRLAVACMRRGDFAQAKTSLDDVLRTLGGIYGKDPDAKKSRSYFVSENKKTFIGEPYERVMAYYYRGILYWMDGEPDNARACFRTGQIEDSSSEGEQYNADYVLLDYLDGLASMKLGEDGSDAFKRSQSLAKGEKPPPYAANDNVLCFLDFGAGPRKYARGEYHEELHFRIPPSRDHSAEIDVEGQSIRVGPYDDLGFQATTRGGRVMDHVLANKAVFKTSTDVAGNAAIIGGAIAASSRNQTSEEVGAGLIVAGIVSKIVSAETTPGGRHAHLGQLPRYLSFAELHLSPGPHTATVQFFGSSGELLADLTKTINFTVPADNKDKVILSATVPPRL